jgi:hypothetical protein
MGKGAKVPSPKALPPPPNPTDDTAAKQAAADATAATKVNNSRRSLAAGVGDTSEAPVSAPGLKSTLGGGPSPS